MHLFEYGKNSSINVYKLNYNKQDLIDYKEKLIELNSIYSIEARSLLALNFLKHHIDINYNSINSSINIFKSFDNREIIDNYINGEYDLNHIFRLATFDDEFNLIKHLGNFIITEGEKKYTLLSDNNYRLDNLIKLKDELVLLHHILNSNWEYIEKKKLYNSEVWSLFKLERKSNLTKKSISKLNDYGLINEDELFKINNNISKTNKILKQIKTD